METAVPVEVHKPFSSEMKPGIFFLHGCIKAQQAFDCVATVCSCSHSPSAVAEPRLGPSSVSNACSWAEHSTNLHCDWRVRCAEMSSPLRPCPYPGSGCDNFRSHLLPSSWPCDLPILCFGAQKPQNLPGPCRDHLLPSSSHQTLSG